MQQMVVALIGGEMIRPDPIIKTSLHHLSCDKKVKITVNRVTARLSDRGLCSRRENVNKIQSKIRGLKKNWGKGRKTTPMQHVFLFFFSKAKADQFCGK